MSAVPPHTDMEAGEAPATVSSVAKRTAGIPLWIFHIFVWLVGTGICLLTIFYSWVPSLWSPAILNGWQVWVNYVRLSGSGLIFLDGIFVIIVMAVISIGPGGVIAAAVLMLLGVLACGVTFVFDLIDFVTYGCTGGKFTCNNAWDIVMIVGEGTAFVFGIVVVILLFVLSNRRKETSAQPRTIKVSKAEGKVKEDAKDVPTDIPVEAKKSEKDKEDAQTELSSLKPYLGMSLRDTGEEGCKVSGLREDGPAQAAGIREGDDILTVDGTKVDDNDEFKLIMKEASPGEELPMKLERGTETLDLIVRFGASGIPLDRVIELRRLAGPEFCAKMDEAGAARVKEGREEKKKSKKAVRSPITRQKSKGGMRRQASKGEQLRSPGKSKDQKKEQAKKVREEEEAREKKAKEEEEKKKKEAAKQKDKQERAEASAVSEEDRENARKRLSGLKSSLGLSLKDGPSRGALISRVKDGHAAARAGLLKGDIVLTVGDIQVDDNDDFKIIMREAAPGEVEVFAIKRKNEEMKIPVTFGGSGVFFTEIQELRELAGKEYCDKLDGAGADAIRAKIAQKAENVSDDDRKKAQDKLKGMKASLGMGVSDGPARGAKVGGIKSGSAAEIAGIRSSDIVMDVDGSEVNSMDDFKAVCKAAAPGETNEFVIMRGGDEQIIPVVFGAVGATIEEILELRRKAGAAFCKEIDGAASYE